MKKYSKGLPEYVDAAKKEEFEQKVKDIIYLAPETVSPPEIVAEIDVLKEQMFGIKNNFSGIKKHFNNFILSIEDKIKAVIDSSANPLKTALKYSMMGNYIDFGAMENVDEEHLFKMIEDADSVSVDEKEFSKFEEEIKRAEKLVFLTDNCGEIVFDKVLMNTIKKLNPGIEIVAIVRGAPTLNDATMEDAVQIELDKIVKVIDNGTAIAGTCLEKISPQAMEEINSADVILSKGQGNFETLRGSGKNVYYAFMCKCEMFSRRFGVPKFTGMFINDFRISL